MRAHAFMTLVLGAVSAVPAIADVPPPEGYVETCTIAKRQTATSECLACASWVSQINRCTNLLVPYCYTKVCKTYGASAWTEVFCRTKDPNAPVVPSDTITILTSPGGAPLDSPDSGVAVAPATCAPYTPSTDTSATTSTSTTKNKSSACSVTSERSAGRALGPLTLILASLALVALRRRSRR